MHKHFQCFYTNADSLLNKFHEFKSRLHSSHCLVAGITEVKPKKNRFTMMPSELAIDGYDLYHTNVDTDIGRGGHTVYT